MIYQFLKAHETLSTIYACVMVVLLLIAIIETATESQGKGMGIFTTSVFMALAAMLMPVILHILGA